MKKLLCILRMSFLILLIFVSCLNLFAQTNPTPQSLPYSVTFGTTTFTTMPDGTISWTVNSSPIGSQTNAQNSTANGNATVTTATAPLTTGGTYGYCTSGNGQLYFQTSSNTTNGTNQLCIAINTTGFNTIKVSYDVEMISSNPRTIGLILQYRIGTTGSWTNVTGGVYSHNTDRSNGQVDSYTNLSLPQAAENNSVVQLRWASWRGTQTGNSSGAALDNISITASSTYVNGFFRSVQSGNWNDVSTWEASTDNVNWYAANIYPKYTANTVTVQSGHNVTITATDTIDQVVVNGTLTYANVTGSTPVINNGTGSDLIINGIFEDAGPNSIIWLSNSSWSMGANATLLRTRSTSSDNWRDHYYNGISNIPATANWIIRKIGGDSPTLSTTSSMYYPNLYIENNTGTIWVTGAYSSFTGFLATPTIKGSLNVGGNGSGNVSFLNENTYSSPVIVNASLTLKSGSVLRNYGTGYAVAGDLVLNGTIDNGSSNSTIMMLGDANQNISASDTIRFNNFQLSKAHTFATITLQSPAIVKGTFTFIKGYLITSSTNVLTFNNHASATGANDSAFVKGPVKKIGNTAFTFPIGKGNNYQPLGISASRDTTDAFTAEYFNIAQAYGTATDPTFSYISTCEYFNLDRNRGTSDVVATLGYDLSSCVANMYPGPRVIGWDGTKWKDLGVGDFTYSAFSGTISTDGSISQYGPLTLGNNPDDLTFATDTAYVPNSFRFMKNNGQIAATDYSLRPDIKYYIPNTYPETYFSDSTLYYVFSKIDTLASTPDTLFRIDVKYLGTENNTYPVAQRRDESHTNYFLGHCPHGVLNVPQSQRLNYGSLYPKIDLIYTGNNSGLVMNFILHPGCKPDQIRAQYSGADSIKIITGGKLCIYSPLGNIVYEAPNAFNIDSSNNFNVVNCAWLMQNDSTVKFSFPNGYNQHFPIIVRINKGYAPVPTTFYDNIKWSSYYSGTNHGNFDDVKTTQNGVIYTSGYTFSTNFPVTPGVYQDTLAGAADAVIVKFNKNNSLSWATFYGGNDNEYNTGLAVDPKGYIFVEGTTQSTNLPMSVAHPGTTYIDSTLSGQKDIFIIKMDTLGQNLMWATYYGGPYIERGTDIAIDSHRNLYVTGTDANIQTPLLHLSGAFNDSLKGTGVIIKFDSLCHRKWATLYGVTEMYTGVQSIGIDLQNNVYVTGAIDTGNTNFPLVAPSGAYLDTIHGSGDVDAYITKFNPNDSAVWSTYYGGNGGGIEYGHKIVVDNYSQKLYVLGVTSSNDFPFFYPGGSTYIDSIYAGGYYDGFILQFDLNTLQRKWATYYGGHGYDDLNGQSYFTDIARGVATVDKFGNLYVSGTTSSTDFPTKPKANMYFQSLNTAVSPSTYNTFISAFNSSCEQFWSTYIAGSHNHSGCGIAAFDTSCIYLVGNTRCDENATTPFPLLNPGLPAYFDGTFNGTPGFSGTYNSFIMKLALSPVYAGLQEHSIDNNPFVLIYPNPTTNEVTIQIESLSQEKFSIEIYNVLGERVYQKNVKNSSAIYKDNISLGGLSSGLYILYIKCNNKVISDKIIKQ